MTDLLARVAGWTRELGLPTDETGQDLVRVTPVVGGAIDLRFSAGKLWFRQQLPVPPSTTDAAAITACRLVNLTRRGPLDARWRGGFVELTGSMSSPDCTRDAVAWMFREARTMGDLISHQLST